MKALWMGVAGAVVIAVAAGVVMQLTEQPSAAKFSSATVSLPQAE